MAQKGIPPGKVEENFWSLTPEQALSGPNADSHGLSEKTAQERLKQYGTNSLKGGSRTSGLMLFLQQFKSPVTVSYTHLTLPTILRV